MLYQAFDKASLNKIVKLWVLEYKTLHSRLTGKTSILSILHTFSLPMTLTLFNRVFWSQTNLHIPLKSSVSFSIYIFSISISNDCSGLLLEADLLPIYQWQTSLASKLKFFILYIRLFSRIWKQMLSVLEASTWAEDDSSIREGNAMWCLPHICHHLHTMSNLFGCMKNQSLSLFYLLTRR